MNQTVFTYNGFPKVGTRPIIDGRRRGIREALEDQTMTMAKAADLRGVRTVVGVGNALRLNPCLKTAIEKRFRARCIIPDVREMAAFGAALYVMDRHRLSIREPGRTSKSGKK